MYPSLIIAYLFTLLHLCQKLLVCTITYDWFRLIFLTGVYLFGPHFDLYQSLNRLPIWNSQNCSIFPLAFVAGWLQGHWWGFISRNYVVWPTFFLMNVFIALKGSHFWFYILNQICMYTYTVTLWHVEELNRFWWHWPNFQGYSALKLLHLRSKTLVCISHEPVGRF